jgi:hypothetical protein
MVDRGFELPGAFETVSVPNSAALAETDALISCAVVSGFNGGASALVGLLAGSVAVITAEGKALLAGKPPISALAGGSFSSVEVAFVAATAFIIGFEVASILSESTALFVSVAARDRGTFWLSCGLMLAAPLLVSLRLELIAPSAPPNCGSGALATLAPLPKLV